MRLEIPAAQYLAKTRGTLAAFVTYLLACLLTHFILLHLTYFRLSVAFVACLREAEQELGYQLRQSGSNCPLL